MYCLSNVDQNPIYEALLPVLGYNRHLPLAVRHGPRSHGGAGMIHMYTEQGIKHLQHTLSLLRQDIDLPKQLRITMSNYQMLIGTQTLFLNLDMKLFPYQVKGRLAFLWKFSNENNITYDIPGIWQPPPPKQNNYNLMEYFTFIPNIAKPVLFQLEVCRLYLQVNNLSELVSNNGQHLEPTLLYPPINYTDPSPSKWPHQP